MNHAGHAYPNNINDDDQIPSDIVNHNGHNQTNGISPKLNGIQSFNAPSPATDSPATPVSNVAAPDVKIDMDYQEQESDARHEPFPIKLIDDQLDKGHVVTEITSNDQGTPPVHPPTTTTTTTNNNVNNMKHPNGHTSPSPHHQQHQHPDDIVMADTDSQLAHTPGISQDFSMASIDTNYNSQQSTTRSYPDDNDDQREPPAKRARVHSDADMASTAHSATPPPASAVMSHATSPVPPPPTSSTTAPPTTATSTMSYANLESTLSINQYRFCLSTIRSLKKSKDAAPFLRPVDPVALNIPHYPSIIKTPMDVSTIERKLASSNPAKPDPNDYNPRYLNADEFSGDVRQIYNNTATFNGPEHVITAMGKRMLELFEKMMKNMPANEKPKPPPVKKIEKIATPPPPPPPVVAPPPKKLPPAARRASTSVPVIRRSDRPEAEPASAARPKREIHPPPPKDLPYQDLPKKRKHKKTQDDGTAEQLKYCNKILQEMHKKQHWTIANPFYEPVDWQKLDIPMYPKIIKKPMDLSTMRRRLDAGHYETAQGFYDDFKLMIRNCFTFNPPGSPVNSAGQDLQRLFDEKWKGLPPLITHEPSEDEEDEEDDSEVERQRAIAQMESQIESMRDKLTQLKNKAPKEKKKKEKKEKAPVASTSKPPPKPPKAAPAPPPKKKSKKPIADDDVLTFDQKKDLSEAIGRLEGAPLERVIQIIHEGVPEIRDSTEEIELEIDLLPAAVLTKLYNYVIRPIKQQQAAPKRNRTGKGTGTGGLKRKSMDEEKEAEKIRQLEERMALFDRGADASGHSASARRHHDSEHSSDSSSGSDSSGSDSE